MPIVKKVRGKETVESVVSKYKNTALLRLKPSLDRLHLLELPKNIVLVGLKEERILQVYAKKENEFELLKEYPFTAFSGQLGPKLTEGDKQIPEGIYYTDYLNPNSSYYLSIKVSYPNEFDRQKTKHDAVEKLGGNIFIHGKAATIGCIPIGDEAIEEVFLLVDHANKNPVKVIISPWDFRKKSEEPNIEGIDWENELYAKIKEEFFAL